MNVRCPYCGNIISSDFKFCDKCGVQVDDTFEYVPGRVIANEQQKNEDRTIKDSLMKSMIIFVLVFLAYFLVVPTVVAIIYLVLSAIMPSVIPDSATLNNTQYALLNMILNEISNTIIVGIILLISAKNKRIKEFFGPKKATKGQMLTNTIVHGVITFGLMFAAMYVIAIISMFLPAAEETNANQAIVESYIHSYPVMGFITVSIMAPLVEELVFRFLLCKPIEQKQKWLGVIISAVVFGGIHLVASVQEGTLLQDLPSLVSYVGMGLVLGVRYKMTDNIASNMVAHSLYNTMSFIMILAM